MIGGWHPGGSGGFLGGSGGYVWVVSGFCGSWVIFGGG